MGDRCRGEREHLLDHIILLYADLCAHHDAGEVAALDCFTKGSHPTIKEVWRPGTWGGPLMQTPIQISSCIACADHGSRVSKCEMAGSRIGPFPFKQRVVKSVLGNPGQEVLVTGGGTGVHMTIMIRHQPDPMAGSGLPHRKGCPGALLHHRPDDQPEPCQREGEEKKIALLSG